MSDSEKWECSSCTYLNYRRTMKCTMCRQPHSSTTSKTESDNSNERTTNNNFNNYSMNKRWRKLKESNEKQCENDDNKNSLTTSTTSSVMRRSPSSSLSTTTLDDKQNKYSNINSNEENKKNIVDKWKCERCTYLNYLKTRHCCMCGQESPINLEFKSNDNRETSITTTTNEEKIDRNNSPKITINDESNENKIRNSPSSDQSESVVIPSNKWKCDACTYENYQNSRRCTLCGQSRSFLQHKPHPANTSDRLNTMKDNKMKNNVNVRRTPCSHAVEAAFLIQKHLTVSLSLIKVPESSLICYTLDEWPTFILPANIFSLRKRSIEQLYHDSFDRFMQKELEKGFCINWCEDVRDTSCLFAIWNKGAGDCLLNSVLQALYGVLDTDNILRNGMARSMERSSIQFKKRCYEYEVEVASNNLKYELSEDNWDKEWKAMLRMGRENGSALDQVHVFVLAHVLRRPIIIYSVKHACNLNGEAIDFVRFQGIYLPLLWKQSTKCFKSPIALGYVKDHFCALLAVDQKNNRAINQHANVSFNRRDHNNNSTNTILNKYYLPIEDFNGDLLPVHFVSSEQMGHERQLLDEWMDIGETNNGHLVAKASVIMETPVVSTLIDDWIDAYRSRPICTDSDYQ
ncbi:hypothetical protein SNEBB_009597 [Seison nebaliae]|nr:hypothetical protein SNEBB_009597 [Seison nebaliae]